MWQPEINTRGRLRVAFTSLGCKVNWADGESLLERLGEGIQLVPFTEEADLYIVNSCTVTATADRQTRQMVYRARRRNPLSQIVLTGCLARVDRQKAAKVVGVDQVFALSEHDALISLVQKLRAEKHLRALSASTMGEDSFPAREICHAVVIHRRSRPLLKIQDGCNAACSYCIVPRARGPSTSVHPAGVHRRMVELTGQGFHEIVLTGIHLGLYGHDLLPPLTLAQLVEQLTSYGPRLRLSSLEPLEVTPELCRLILHTPTICPHLHIPIQSADETVLALMNRPYSAKIVQDLLQQLRARHAQLALGADFIVGFPGETEEQFRRSLTFVQESALTHLHVFPYSTRPQTKAATMGNSLPWPIISTRAKILREAGQHKLVSFAAQHVGQVRQVLLESRGSNQESLLGLTDNYLRVEVLGSEHRLGQLAWVRVEAAQGTMLRGSLIDLD